MKEKRKIILQAILVSVIITGIFLIVSYLHLVTSSYPSQQVGSTNLPSSVDNPILHLYIPYLIVGLLFMFPLVTLISSFVIIHYRVKKK